MEYVPLIDLLVTSTTERFVCRKSACIYCMVITYRTLGASTGIMVANPACGQLNSDDNGFSPVPFRAREFGLASLFLRTNGVGGGGGLLSDIISFCFIFLVKQTRSGIGHRVM